MAQAENESTIPPSVETNGAGHASATEPSLSPPSSPANLDEEIVQAHWQSQESERKRRSPSPEIVFSEDGQQLPALDWLVVGIGASAGGLQALREIFEHLPADTGLSFALVTHLAPDKTSHLTEIMARHTAMPVLPIQEGVQPQPNHVYMLLPNEVASLKGGRFHVVARERKPHPNSVIDTFFRSLAADQKNHAIGAVLSGGDGDGASGLKTIKGDGGITLVQTPETAQHASMPRSSIAADHVDRVLSPADLGNELARIAEQFRREPVRALERDTASPAETEEFQRILAMLRSVAGIDFPLYKPQTLRRRIARRIVLLRLGTLADYLRHLQRYPDELTTLHEEVLINVTRFFRDADFWHAFGTVVLPSVMQGRTPDKPLRLWCAGCASGEEAYSLAISVLEYLSANNLDVPVQIFATDASATAIDMARNARYTENLAGEMSSERLRRFFVKIGDGYQVTKRVRSLCVFAQQNLSSDPPFSHIDILSCRNVLIYFNQVLQRQVMTTFHYALDAGGYLLLGMSEGLREYSGMFSAIDRHNKIYAKVGHSYRNGLDLPRYFSRPQVPMLSPVKETYTNWQDFDLERTADRIALARFCPPGLIIDEHLNVIQVRGQTSAFIQLPSGNVTWSLLRILREEIAGQIAKRLNYAVEENLPCTVSPVRLGTGPLQRDLQVDILPLSAASADMRYFLIVLQGAPEPPPGVDASSLGPGSPAALAEADEDSISTQLRLDLSTTRFHLQSLTEERNAHNQELVSANEEIQSANEELQSSNEELETTKEELQSSNEELQTVNEELQQQNIVLGQTGNDLTNLLHSVNIPLLMLGSDFKIRQFTPPMQRLLNVRPGDIGRSISEIRLQLSIEDIQPILMDVMETLGTREVEVQDREGRWNLLRVRPYRTADNRIEGLVVVLVDIDQLRRSQAELIESRDFVSSVVEGVPVPIVVLDQDGSVRSNNSAFAELTRMPTREMHRRLFPDLVRQLWGIVGLKEKLDALTEAQGLERLDFEQRATGPDATILRIKAQVLSRDSERVFLLVLEDITQQREAEEVLAAQKDLLQATVVKTEGQLNRTQEELRGLTAHLFTVQEEERQRVSRELHDDVSQRLSALELMLRTFTRSNCSEEETEQIDRVREQLHSLNTDVRQISHRLHPAILKDLGLSAALHSLVSEFGEREGMPADFIGQDIPEEIAPQVGTAVYRITQEALRNVAKHAGKTHVKVLLKRDADFLRLEVLDLGMGFDQDEPVTDRAKGQGLGLISMKERARLADGTFTITSALGSGTEIVVEVPLAAHA